MRDYVGEALRDDRNKAPVAKVRRKTREQYLLEAYPLSYYAEFNAVLQLDSIVKGVLAKGHNSYLFGPPGGGKSGRCMVASLPMSRLGARTGMASRSKCNVPRSSSRWNAPIWSGSGFGPSVSDSG